MFHRIGDITDAQVAAVKDPDVWFGNLGDPYMQVSCVPGYTASPCSLSYLVRLVQTFTLPLTGAEGATLELQCQFVLLRDQLGTVGPRSFTLAHRAAAAGSTALLKVALSVSPSSLGQSTTDGYTPLDLAAQGSSPGHTAVVRYILSDRSTAALRASVSVTSRSTTPLHHVAVGGNTASLALFMRYTQWFAVRDQQVRQLWGVGRRCCRTRGDVVCMSLAWCCVYRA